MAAAPLVVNLGSSRRPAHMSSQCIGCDCDIRVRQDVLYLNCSNKRTRCSHNTCSRGKSLYVRSHSLDSSFLHIKQIFIFQSGFRLQIAKVNPKIFCIFLYIFVSFCIFESKNIISDNQAGFPKGRSTTDNIYILNYVIEKKIWEEIYKLRSTMWTDKNLSRCCFILLSMKI